MPPNTLLQDITAEYSQFEIWWQAYKPPLTPVEIGTITNVSTGIASVRGLPGVGYNELVQFSDSEYGFAFNIEADEVGVVLLGDSSLLHAGDPVKRTGRVMDICVGDALLGRVLDPLGRPLDGKRPIKAEKRLPIEREAKSIMDRSPVNIPLQTGVKAIDALIPIGRGQRELILGDRQTGKTAIAIASIVNQRDQNVICVYCAIGRRSSAVAKVIAQFAEHGAMDYTVVVMAEGSDAPGLMYAAPYAATSIAEYFMESGRDVLIVYDDLTQHAESYREISLLLRRPPGREAFPGDIFYIHSRLLERATHLKKEIEGGSMTALPIIETDAQDISAYIPTNLISITDGQIYLSPDLFELEILPAIDVAKSVSRVGSSAQCKAYRGVAGDLKLGYSQFEELESFAKLGTHLDPATQKVVDHGQRIRAILKQGELDSVSVDEQICLLIALAAGLFEPISIDNMETAEQTVRNAAKTVPAEISQRFSKADLSDDDRKAILAILSQALSPPKPTP